MVVKRAFIEETKPAQSGEKKNRSSSGRQEIEWHLG